MQYKAALQSEGRRCRKPINELTKSKWMHLASGPINYFTVSMSGAHSKWHGVEFTMLVSLWPKWGGKWRMKQAKKSCMWLWQGNSEDKRICGCWVTFTSSLTGKLFLTPQHHPQLLLRFPALVADTTQKSDCFMGTSSGILETSKQCQEEDNDRALQQELTEGPDDLSGRCLVLFGRINSALAVSDPSELRQRAKESSDFCATDKRQLQEWISPSLPGEQQSTQWGGQRVLIISPHPLQHNIVLAATPHDISNYIHQWNCTKLGGVV